ncbi:E3 ubiquitin-protein ligase RMA3 [Euphorbia peplus]|nr:E3 ubiquitin-protein ligase RMA3 [Euphorbia peplus]
MDARQSLFQHEMPFESDEHKQNFKSLSTTRTSMSRDDSDCFACNICLDSAYDPIVTLCGHLYCWPCIYKWLHIKSSEQQPDCPVCKANISLNSLVPLYGRGISRSDSMSKKASQDVLVPQRPTPTLDANTLHQTQHPQSNLFHQHRNMTDSYGGGYGALASTNIGGAAMTQIFSPMIGMFGELIFARVFGTPDTNLFAYSYPPDSNSLMGRYSHPRMRRHEMQLDKSLNRVTIFLFCCIILCLLLF